MEDPEVHVRFFEGLTAMRIAGREVWEARDGFKRRSDAAVFDRMRAALKEVQLSSSDDWARIIPAWALFLSQTKGGNGNIPHSVNDLRSAA